MKIAIFDVSNGSCALAVCANGNSVMFDCGSHQEKDCPVERINALRIPGSWLSGMKNYQVNGTSYPLTKLVISHPDLDHVKNIEKVHTKFTPYLLHRRYIEHFPVSVVHQDHESYAYYRDKVCATYRSSPTQIPVWGFSEHEYQIPMETLKDNPLFGDSKMKNNSSIVFLLQYGNFRILFGGDMETVGWDWMIDNNHTGFRDELSKGVDIFVASHHGHTSGYSQKLMNLIGSPKLAILSKGSETGTESDVDCRYSATSQGYPVQGLSMNNNVIKKTLTTRSNGNIYIDVNSVGIPTVYADCV